MALDHGLLNLPIGNRARGGSIDAQLDFWKAEQAKAERFARKRRAAHVKADRELAKRLVDAMTDAQIGSIAAKSGRTIAQVRKALMSDAHWFPASIIRAFA